MRKDELLNEYYDYLCNEFKLSLPKYGKYRRLLVRLFETEFVWSIEMDENRALDGFDLRYEFLNRMHYRDKVDIWEDPVTVLEVLLAFSRRIEVEIMSSDPGKDNISKWFWEMIDNLGLLRTGIYDNKEEIDRILDIWMNRKFSKTGKGNIFRTHRREYDLREVEFWWQMQRYMSEMYGD